jgi:rhamnosyl/mannosyltransferase
MDMGDEITILCFGKTDKIYTGKYGETVHQIRENFRFLSASFNWRLPFIFLKLIKQLNPDKIYAHLPNPSMHLLMHLFARFLTERNVICSAVYHNDVINQRIFRFFYETYFFITSTFYDEMICSSEKLWKTSPVLRHMPISKRRLLHFRHDGDNNFHKRSEFNKRLLAIGRLVPYKGYDFLIDALADSEYNLTIVGDGPMRRALERKKTCNIILTGDVNDEMKRKIMNENDLLVVSSINRSEGYGLTIVEAFENGMPVVASDVQSGVTFLVEDGVRGKTFTARSKTKLLEALKSFDDEPDLIARCSDNCRKFYEDKLTYEKYRETVASLLRKPTTV